MEELMNIKEAATYLRLNYMTVYKLAQKRRLPAFKVGGNWRFKRDVLDNWLTQQANANLGTVLVIDDDPEINELLKQTIKDQQYGVVSASTAAAALEELEKQHFDLIFLDLLLCESNGTQLLKSIKEKDKNAVIALVYSSADESLTFKAMASGPLMLIRKPIREKDVLEILDVAMKRKS